nr:STAS domain-containing protein [Planomicrobium sp. YIM 101495]
MDYATYSYSTAYLETYRRRLAASRRQFLELSAPVVPVTEKIAILPLVGDIDLDRGRFILERVLQEATRLDVDTLILDLSGVVQVDENVVEQMTKITRSLKIVGIKPVLTGIRPEIAKMMVAIGINKEELLVGGTLKQVFQRISKGHFA